MAPGEVMDLKTAKYDIIAPALRKIGIHSSAAAMCRIRLYRSPDPLPDVNCAMALCRYWKLVYNRVAGAGQVDSAHISLFQQAIEA